MENPLESLHRACLKCNIIFSTHGNLNKHKRSVHNEVATIISSDGKKRSGKANPNSIHGCIVCKKFFSTPGNLNRHQKTNHKVNAASGDQSEISETENPRPVYLCVTCNKIYKTQNSVDKHMRIKHNPVLLEQSVLSEAENSPPVHRCFACNTAFRYKSNLRKHMWIKHNQADEALNPVLRERGVLLNKLNKCLENGCNSSFKTSKKLLAHLEAAHEKSFEIRELQFQNLQEFQSWRLKMEHESNVKYNLMGRNEQKIYYCCHRSAGRYISKSDDRKRKPRSKGPSNLNYNCISRIEASLTKNLVTATWIKTHYGHSELDLQHVPLSSMDRLTVAAKLISGVSPDRILSSIREDTDPFCPKRIDLLTRKDISNIANCFNISVISHSGKSHGNAPQSSDLLTQDCMSTEDNPTELQFGKAGENIYHTQKTNNNNSCNKMLRENSAIDSSTMYDNALLESTNIVDMAFEQQLQQKKIDPSIDIRKEAASILNQIMKADLTNCGEDVLRQIKHSLQTLRALTSPQNLPEHFSQPSVNIPTEKLNVNPQISFYSTNKRNSMGRVSLCKPNADEYQTMLSGGKTNFISKDKFCDHAYE